VAAGQIYNRGVGYILSAPYGLHSTGFTLSSTVANSCAHTAATPLYLSRSTTFDEIGVRLTTPATDVDAVLELGWCPATSDTFYPDWSQVTSAGTVSIQGGVARDVTIAINTTLNAGLWWLLAGMQSPTSKTGTNPQFTATTSYLPGSVPISYSSNAAAIVRGQRSADAIISTSTTTFITGLSTPTYMRIGMKVSSF
jgi:hypothetical protein